MSELAKQSCEACRVDAKLLSSADIENLLPQIETWQLVEESGVKKLKRAFSTKNYTQSLAFTNAVAELAETINHHPQLLVEYSLVTVVWWSHKIKGLHKTDFIMAAKTSELFESIF